MKIIYEKHKGIYCGNNADLGHFGEKKRNVSKVKGILI